jgi:tetratricopeptide (TPR) repeat protein
MDKAILQEISKLCNQEKFQEALDQLDELLSRHEDWLEARYNRAKVHFKLGQFEACIADFDKIIDADASNAHWLSERAVAYLLKGDPQHAIKDLDEAAALEPENPYRYSSRAFVKDRAGDYHGAIADYEKAIALDPEDAIAYNNKGLVEEKIGWKEKAQKSFAKADQYDPKRVAHGQPEAKTKAEKEGYKEMPATQISSPSEALKKHTAGAYWAVIRSQLSTRKGWAEFFAFIGDKLQGKH